MRRITLSTILAASAAIGVWGQTESRTGQAKSPSGRTESKTSFLPSEIANKNLPKWLNFSFEDRARFESLGGIGFKAGADDAYVLNRLRLSVGVAPFKWMRFKAEAQDARVWGYSQGLAPASMKNSFDLRQGYIELSAPEKTTYVVRAGRQTLAFGEGRLVADPQWGNGRSFDAIRTTFQYKQAKLDAFAASVVKPKDGEFDWNTGADNFHGLYGALRNVVPDSTIEPFGFWRLCRSLKSETGRMGSLDTKTLGVRWFGKLPLDMDYNVELARQFGVYSTDSVSAWAGHWVVGRTLKNYRIRPRIYGEYNYATGDSNAKDGRRGTFDQLYPSSHDKFGLVDQAMWSNIHHARGALEFSLSKAWSVKTGYHSFWLADRHDGLYTGGKLIARVADGSAGSHIGQEVDGQVFWTVSKALQINAGYGRILPGSFIHRALPGSSYNQFFLNVSQTF